MVKKIRQLARLLEVMAIYIVPHPQAIAHFVVLIQHVNSATGAVHIVSAITVTMALVQNVVGHLKIAYVSHNVAFILYKNLIFRFAPKLYLIKNRPCKTALIMVL